MEDKTLLLQNKLDTHIDAFDKHVDKFEEHCTNEEKRWDHLITAQEHNSECIKELTLSTQALTESTKGVVNAWNAANGTVTVMSALSKFVKWLGSLGFVILAFNWVMEKVPWG